MGALTDQFTPVTHPLPRALVLGSLLASLSSSESACQSRHPTTHRHRFFGHFLFPTPLSIESRPSVPPILSGFFMHTPHIERLPSASTRQYGYSSAPQGLRPFRVCPGSPQRWAVDLFLLWMFHVGVPKGPTFDIGCVFRLLAASVKCWIRRLNVNCRWRASHFEGRGPSNSRLLCSYSILLSVFSRTFFYVFLFEPSCLDVRLGRASSNLALLSPKLGWMELSEQRFVSSGVDAIVGRGPCIKGLCVLLSPLLGGYHCFRV